MARIRTVKPEFWTSEQVADCSPTARLLFIGMWNFCDDQGVHPASAKRLKMEVFPADSFTPDQIEALVSELIEAGLLTEFTAEGAEYWAVTGWKHQKIEKPSNKYPAPPSKREIADQSPNPRRPIAESSPPEGKGRESNSEAKASGAVAPLPSKSEIVSRETSAGDPWKDIYDGFKKHLGTRSGGLISKLKGVSNIREMRGWLAQLESGGIADGHEYLGKILTTRCLDSARKQATVPRAPAVGSPEWEAQQRRLMGDVA